jgi:hypothetical protein
MSCRIERVITDDNCLVFRLSGRIQAKHVPMIRDLLRRENSGMAIDLKEVILVAREAVDLLALSEANGIELRNCPSYLREWLDREKSRKAVGPLDHEKEGREDVEDS